MSSELDVVCYKAKTRCSNNCAFYNWRRERGNESLRSTFSLFRGLHFKNRHFQNSLFSRFSVFHFFFNFSILSSQWTWIWDGCWERSDKKSKGTELISTSNRVRERRVVIRRVGVESNLSVFISSDGVYICAKKKQFSNGPSLFCQYRIWTHTRRDMKTDVQKDVQPFETRNELVVYRLWVNHRRIVSPGAKVRWWWPHDSSQFSSGTSHTERVLTGMEE